MAREILVLKLSPSSGAANLIFQYPIPAPERQTYTDAQGQTITVVPTPSGGLPDEAKELYTAAELAAFDDGSAFWRSFTLNIDGLSPAQAAAKARAVYSQKGPEYRDQYEKIYSRLGTFIDVP